MKVIKLGGSIITYKESYKKINKNSLGVLCDVLSESKEERILIHGAGSFGHIMALKYGLEKPGSIKGKEEAISKVVSDVLILNSVIIEYLNESGINAISVPPHVIYNFGKPDFTVVKSLTDKGFVPVLFGDIIMNKGRYRIISGDEIALDLSRVFRPESVAFITDVDGLFDSDPKTNKNARFIPLIKAGEISVVDTGRDATGSMAGKMKRIKKMMSYTGRVVVLNGNRPERLRNYLRGKESISTVIK